MPADKIMFRSLPHISMIASTGAARNTVMSSGQVSSGTLLHIEEELDSEEQEVISYACQGTITNTNTRELLSKLNESVHGLTEILYLVKRFDLLKKYLKLTKADVEKLMTSKSRIISDYRNLVVDLNNQIEEDDLESLVFLLKDNLRNAGKLKNKTFLSLVIELEKNRLITSENLTLLENNFQTIRRVDLKKLILKFKQKGETQMFQYERELEVADTATSLTV